MSLLTNLFDPHAPETRGERVQGALFELSAIAILAYFAFEWAFVMSHYQRVVKPLALARYVDVSLLFELRWALANATLLTLLGLLALVMRMPRLHLVGVALFHLQFVARYSLGKASHASHFAGIALLSLGVAALLFEGKLVRRAAVGLTVFFYGLSYSCAALVKLIATGPRWVDGHHLWLWIHEKQIDLTSQFGSWSPNLLQRFMLESRALATLSLTFGLLTEAFAWLMWWQKPRPFVMLALVGMHLGVQLTMDISFWANQVMLSMLALPIASWIDRRAASSCPASPVR